MNARGFIFHEHSTYIELSVGSFHFRSFRKGKKVMKEFIFFLFLLLYIPYKCGLFHLYFQKVDITSLWIVNPKCIG